MPTATSQADFDSLENALKNNNFEEVKKILSTFDITATNEYGQTCLMIASGYSRSLDIAKLFFEKIDEACDVDILKSQLSATSRYGHTCLLRGCYSSTSPDVMKLVFQKMAEAFGEDALKRELAAATKDDGMHFFEFVCRHYASDEVKKLVAGILFHYGLFDQQYFRFDSHLGADTWGHRKDLNERVGIKSSSWTPDAASHAEIETLLKGGSFIHAIHNNQQSKIKEFLSNDSEAKKIFDSNLDSIVRACAGPQTTLETVNVLFSEVELACGDQFLQDLLKKEDNAGKIRLLSVSWSYPESLKLFLDIVDERTGSREELLPEKKKIRREYESFLFYALIKFAPNYRSLSTLISKIFDSESFGRRYLREEFHSKPCLECLFARRLDSPDEMKMLLLIVSLYSITGVFGDRYSRLDNDAKKTLSLVCQIESGDWRSNNSPMGDVIGEIKNSFKY